MPVTFIASTLTKQRALLSWIKRYIHHIGFWLFATCLSFMASPVFAATTETMPWDTPGQKVENWITGSVAKVVAIVLIAVSGIMFANGEHGSAFRRMMGIVFGISIAVGAVTIYGSLSFSGAEV